MTFLTATFATVDFAITTFSSAAFSTTSVSVDTLVFFRTLLHVLRVGWYPTPLAPLPSARCACRRRCLQSSRASPGTPRCWSLCLEGLHTAPFVGLCSALFPAIVHGGPSSPPGLVPEVIPCRRSARVCSEHLRVGRSWFVAMVWLSPASASRLQSRRSSVVATLRSCRRCGCVLRGQRALLDADTLELIDRFTCLVEPVSVESCVPSVLVLSPAASTSSAASSRCSRMSFPRGLVEGLLLPESSLLAALVVHCDSCSWMIGTFLCSVLWSTSCAS